jgi:hypothetical protein
MFLVQRKKEKKYCNIKDSIFRVKSFKNLFFANGTNQIILISH